jgi:hypothetical protein
VDGLFTKLKNMYWYWIHVYNHKTPLGSFYTDESKKEKVVNEINKRYGEGKWTRFTSE